MKLRRAIVLLSGGLDSATVLALAKEQGFETYALSFAYGQRHEVELEAARRVVAAAGVREHRTVSLDLAQFGGSALTDDSIAVPQAPDAQQASLVPTDEGIPVTYVPARNTLFLATALAWAEVLQCFDIFIGVNAVDYSGYPDCRPEFVAAFQTLANVATKAGVEGQTMTVHAPLIQWTKAEIIRQGTRLGVDYGLTLSCYKPNEQGLSCGRCDSCRIRADGFRAAGVPDPTAYG